jgi:predicted dehydrogenase
VARSEIDLDLDYLPRLPRTRDRGIGAVGAGFIMRDCHLPAYQSAGFRPVAIVSRGRRSAEETAALRGIPRVYDTLVELVADPEVEIVDVAVPPHEQLGVVREILRARGKVRGILAQKPLGMNLEEAREIVRLCEEAGVVLGVNQNMRYDQSIRALKTLLDRGMLGEPVLATIDMRAIPHWMPWQQQYDWLTLRIMSIHHLDAFRFLFGDPERIYASARPDPRTRFPHRDGICLTILEWAGGLRRHARARRRISGSPGGWRGRRGSRAGRSAGRNTHTGAPARSTFRPAASPATGSRPAGRRSGSPTPSSARWRCSCALSRRERSRRSAGGTT